MQISKAIAVGLMLSVPSGVQAREMECQFDFINHVTVNRISEDPKSTNLRVLSYNKISPKYGDESYLFELSPTPEKKWDLKYISGKLYWYEDSYLTELVFVDFEKAILRAFQLPEVSIEQATDSLESPLVFWECRRID